MVTESTGDKVYDFTCTSGFGAKSQEPFVSITCGEIDFHVQMGVIDAGRLATNIRYCAEAAIGDGFLITFLRNRVGLPDDQVFHLLAEYREYRAMLDGGS